MAHGYQGRDGVDGELLGGGEHVERSAYGHGDNRGADVHGGPSCRTLYLHDESVECEGGLGGRDLLRAGDGPVRLRLDSHYRHCLAQGCLGNVR